jgi:hypothetical protein
VEHLGDEPDRYPHAPIEDWSMFLIITVTAITYAPLVLAGITGWKCVNAAGVLLWHPIIGILEGTGSKPCHPVVMSAPLR